LRSFAAPELALQLAEAREQRGLLFRRRLRDLAPQRVLLGAQEIERGAERAHLLVGREQTIDVAGDALLLRSRAHELGLGADELQIQHEMGPRVPISRATRSRRRACSSSPSCSSKVSPLLELEGEVERVPRVVLRVEPRASPPPIS
jgi:hypothetical protein